LRTTLIVFSLAVFVGDDFDEFGFAPDFDALVGEHVLDLAADVLVVEGLGVNRRDVLLDHGVLVVVDVAVDARDGQHDVLGTHAALEETLDEGVGVERAAVDHTASLTAAVSEGLH